MDRVDQLRSFIESRPKDPFPRYALAIEWVSRGRLDEANRAFAELLEAFPDYAPAYLHAGNALVATGRGDEAAETYGRGVVAAGRAGDVHAKGELETALSELEFRRRPQ